MSPTAKISFIAGAINNFGTSIFNGSFGADLGNNVLKGITGVIGFGLGRYGELSTGVMGRVFGTTFIPGVYSNTTDIIIEKIK